ncbi:MAG: mechanosensitive ion channel, partial [Leptospiraceae bacterium]|nr:mechanosensitive ion channel [Leptospiraceae bacterium]
KFQGIVLISEEQLFKFLLSIPEVLKFLSRLLLIYLFTTTIFSLFEFSKGWTAILLSYIKAPIVSVFGSMIGYLPNLFFISIIYYITKYILRLNSTFFQGLESGKVKLSGFHSDWSLPTKRIVGFVLIAFAFVATMPYLPGANSEAFKGVSLFLGFLVSMGSSAFIGNIIAGIVVTYMRSFKVGDRVKISDTVGEVLEKSLLVTRVRTIKNVDITIPNGMVLGSHIVNYSSSAEQHGLILHVTVTIGYDIDWRKVHSMLLESAEGIAEILDTPKPFVLQTALDDFYVHYELNVYTKNPKVMAAIYSNLYKNIQDVFAKNNVEIMSPHFSALRDGNATNIPEDFLPKDHVHNTFKVDVKKKES